MDYYREYIEVTDASGPPHTAEVRLCHDFPFMAPSGGNQVAIFDERVSALARADWSGPNTDTFCAMTG